MASDWKPRLRTLFAEVLDRRPESISDTTSFFEAGGDSVGVMKVVQAAIRNGLALNAQMVYETPRVGDLSARLAAVDAAPLPSQRAIDAAIEPVTYFDLVSAALHQTGLARSQIEDVAPCTPFQAEIMAATVQHHTWLFQTVWQVESGDEARAKQAVGQLYERNAAFRTAIVRLDTGLHQVVLKAEQPRWNEVSADISSFQADDYQRGFKFGEPCTRFAAVRDGAKKFLVWTKTHAIYDRTTKQHYLEDVAAALERPQEFAQKPPRLQYPSFARQVHAQDRESALQYWSGKLKKLSRHDRLFPDTTTQKDLFTTTAGKSVKRSFTYPRPSNTSIGFGAISEVAWALCMANETASREAFFCAMRGGRHQPIVGVESVMGPTFAIVPAVLKLGPHLTLAHLLQAKQQSIFGEISHEAYGVEALNQHFGHQRFWQSVLLPQMPEPDTFKSESNMTFTDPSSGEKTVLRSASELWAHIRVNFALYVMATPKGADQLELWARFDASVLDDARVQDILRKYEELLLAITQSSHEWPTKLVSDLCPHLQPRSVNGDVAKETAATLRNIFPDASSDDAAFVVPSEDPLEMSYKDLSGHIRELQSELASLGIREGHAVSISLPNSYEIVSSFLAVSWQRAIAAPLNPNYKEDEFKFYIEDLGSSLMITEKGAVDKNSAAVRAARSFGAAIAEVEFDGQRVILRVKDKGKLAGEQASEVLEAQEDDIALVLHTSGTTGRPKAVPLTHKNLMTNIDNIVQTYRLSPADRTMLIMPLFHVHGLLASFLSPLRSGGSAVVCARLQPSFWTDFTRLGANWYSATPTMHRLILGFPLPDPLPHIRFIRSCSSQLAPTLFHQLEERFHAPVLESYAMTEASHMMASNPLPPAAHYPGCVGIAQGQVELRILDERGEDLGRGRIGEVCVRGGNVTHGYLNNAAANASSFHANGFFRTGDQGQFDAQTGYLTLTGRLKELINKGGEKISPVELDNSMSQHAEVVEAVCFAIEDETYGQDVGAAVKLVEGSTLEPAALKEWLRERVAAFKLPAKIWICEEIPKTATGKLQRKMVAEKLVKK